MYIYYIVYMHKQGGDMEHSYYIRIDKKKADDLKVLYTFENLSINKFFQTLIDCYLNENQGKIKAIRNLKRELYDKAL